MWGTGIGGCDFSTPHVNLLVYGRRPGPAIGQIRYAECLHKKGELDAAWEHLDRAEAQSRGMGLDWWRSQAEGQRGRIDRGEGFKGFAPYVDGPPTMT